MVGFYVSVPGCDQSSHQYIILLMYGIYCIFREDYYHKEGIMHTYIYMQWIPSHYQAAGGGVLYTSTPSTIVIVTSSRSYIIRELAVLIFTFHY